MASPDISLADAISSVSPDRRLMGLDLGTKTIGVATSDRTRMIATPIETIARKKFTQDAERLLAIANAENIGIIVLGLPVNMDGSEGPRCQSTRSFARNFARLSPIPIVFWDERLSTAAVERMLIQADASRAKRDQVIDKLAAAWILQAALDLAPLISTFESLLPVFLLIALGLVLRTRNVVPADMWRGLELLGYWVFFPALLGDTLIRSDIASLDLSGITITMVGTFTTMALGLLAARRFLMNSLVLDGPAYSSLFQGATRWNGFIALPILAKLYGDEGVALVAVIIGALVPPANILAVAVVAQNAGSQKLTVRETVYVVFRNPFIWATATGLLINLAGIPIYEPVMTSMSMLGGAAIASGLLMVGAGLSTSETIRPSAPVLMGTALKLLGTPLIVILWSFATGVSGTAFVACMVCAAVPTAMSAYVLARQMGGDAPLVAATVMTQTIVSFFSIPLVIMLAQRLQ